jgi:hypothetical protein
MDGNISTMDLKTTEELLNGMTRDPNLLKDGYKIFSSYEKFKNFYINLANVTFSPNVDSKVKKLASSTLKTFLIKNWSDDNYITNDERLVKSS